jgi:hypothetical protein
MHFPLVDPCLLKPVRDRHGDPAIRMGLDSGGYGCTSLIQGLLPVDGGIAVEVESVQDFTYVEHCSWQALQTGNDRMSSLHDSIPMRGPSNSSVVYTKMEVEGGIASYWSRCSAGALFVLLRRKRVML